MEDFLPFLVFAIVAVASMVSNLRKKKKNDAKPKTRTGLGLKLSMIFAEIKSKIELERQKQKAAQEGPSSASEWRRLMEDGPQPDEPEETLADLDLGAEAPPPSPKKPAFVKSYRDRSMPMREREMPHLESEPPPLPAETRKSPRLGRKRLRRAIVWSEILGPPVALRDPHSNLR